jgi:hypothetical protein
MQPGRRPVLRHWAPTETGEVENRRTDVPAAVPAARTTDTTARRSRRSRTQERDTGSPVARRPLAGGVRKRDPGNTSQSHCPRLAFPGSLFLTPRIAGATGDLHPDVVSSCLRVVVTARQRRFSRPSFSFFLLLSPFSSVAVARNPDLRTGEHMQRSQGPMSTTRCRGPG